MATKTTKKPTEKKAAVKNAPVKKAAPKKVVGRPAVKSQSMKPVSVAVAPKEVGFGQAIKNYWTGYVNFFGKSTRAEYWLAWLFVLVVNMVLMWGSPLLAKLHIGWLVSLMSAIMFLPSRALAVRRFRDAGLPGWLYLVPFLAFFIWGWWRGALWVALIQLNYVASDYLWFGGLALVFMIMCLVVFCLPSRGKK